MSSANDYNLVCETSTWYCDTKINFFGKFSPFFSSSPGHSKSFLFSGENFPNAKLCKHSR